MIFVCRKCMPRNRVGYVCIYDQICEVCDKLTPAKNIHSIEISVADIKFEIWTQTFERGHVLR